MSFDVITKEHRPHPKLLVVVQKQLLLCHIESKIYPAALLKNPDLTERFDPLETTYDSISIHKLGLYPLNRLWRAPQAAVQRGRSPPCAPPSAAARRPLAGISDSRPEWAAARVSLAIGPAAKAGSPSPPYQEALAGTLFSFLISYVRCCCCEQRLASPAYLCAC
jgi:hypothetical protein